MTDEQLLALIADPAQRERGFRLLVTTYQERLYQHIRRMVGSHADADDVLQNTFIKVHRSIDRFRGQSRLYTWLYRIATNESLSFLDRNKRRPSSRGASGEDAMLSLQLLRADVEVDGDRIQQLLQSSLELLPPKQRTVFSLRYFDEVNYQDMSDMLGTSVGGLKASYHHAVKKIEQFLREQD